MARGRREHQRVRWLLPAALTLTAAVATAGVYFWKEMEDHEASTGFRSEDEETADEKRRSRGMAGRSFGEAATAAGTGISNRVNEIWKDFFHGGSSGEESDGGTRTRSVGGPSMTGAARPSSSGTSSSVGRSAVARSVRSRDAPAPPPLSSSQEIDWERKKIIALVVSGDEELDESILLSLPTPVDISRWILLIFVYAPPPPPSPSLVNLSPRPMYHRSPSPAMSVKSYMSSKSFTRTQPSPPEVSPETSPSLVPTMRTPLTSGRNSRAGGVLVGGDDDDDQDDDTDDVDVDHLTSTASLTSSRMRPSSRKSKSETAGGYSSMSELDIPTPSVSSNFTRRIGSFRRPRRGVTDTDSDDASEQTSVETSVTLPGLILKTFGHDFPHQQVMHYSTPTGVVHMLRHLGVSLVFISESCASVPSPDGGSYNTSADESTNPHLQSLPGSMPVSPPLLPPGTTASVGGGEVVGMLKDWVGDVVVVLDEDEDDSAPIRPSAVSGGEDDYDERRRRSAKGKERGGPVSEATGRKRRWLKDRSMAKGITICDRQGLKGIWRAKVEGSRS